MGVKGMCWQVLDWNELALNFYKKYEAQLSSGWLNVSIDKQQIEAITDGSFRTNPGKK